MKISIIFYKFMVFFILNIIILKLFVKYLFGWNPTMSFDLIKTSSILVKYIEIYYFTFLFFSSKWDVNMGSNPIKNKQFCLFR